MQMTSGTDIDPLTIIEEEARAVAVSFGIGPSTEMAAAMVDRIVHRLGGGLIYIRAASMRQKRLTHAAVRARFTGNNHEELAKELDISSRHLRRILAKRE
jgi:Mor family transcriptional regulator